MRRLSGPVKARPVSRPEDWSRPAGSSYKEHAGTGADEPVSPSVAGSGDQRIETPPGTIWYAAPPYSIWYGALPCTIWYRASASFPFRFLYRRAPAQAARDGSAEVSASRRIPLRPLVRKSRRGVQNAPTSALLLVRPFSRVDRLLSVHPNQPKLSSLPRKACPPRKRGPTSAK